MISLKLAVCRELNEHMRFKLRISRILQNIAPIAYYGFEFNYPSLKIYKYQYKDNYLESIRNTNYNNSLYDFIEDCDSIHTMSRFKRTTGRICNQIVLDNYENTSIKNKVKR